jgi:hypothetical protein
MSSEPKNAVEKKVYESITFDITVDKAGASHQAEYRSLIY